MSLDNFGFIISRKVTNEKQNGYWNQCVKCIRNFYPFKKIIIIDDNSNRQFLKPFHNYLNLTVIASEYPNAGEILPYYYFYKYHFFNNAVIIHDSVFFHSRIPFEKYCGFKVMPLWHFSPDTENKGNSVRLANHLTNNTNVVKYLTMNEHVGVLNFSIIKENIWAGCFGVQSFINYNFLSFLQSKYSIFNMLPFVKCRADRCCLERIFGVLFHLESKEIKKIKFKSLFGIIFNYLKWGYTFDEYIEDGKRKRLPKAVIKVWSGR